MTLSSHQSARPESIEWLTPPHIIAALGGAESFDLDPCAAPNAPDPWPTARTHYRADQINGLTAPWHGRVWCNPPFSRAATQWARQMALHGHGVLLIQARTETRWWQESVLPHATRILLLAGRLHFHRPDGTRAAANSGAPTALVAYGAADAMVLAHCGLPGHLSPLGRWEQPEIRADPHPRPAP
jgi:hypothetical protein